MRHHRHSLTWLGLFVLLLCSLLMLPRFGWAEAKPLAPLNELALAHQQQAMVAAQVALNEKLLLHYEQAYTAWRAQGQSHSLDQLRQKQQLLSVTQSSISANSETLRIEQANSQKTVHSLQQALSVLQQQMTSLKVSSASSSHPSSYDYDFLLNSEHVQQQVLGLQQQILQDIARLSVVYASQHTLIQQWRSHVQDERQTSEQLKLIRQQVIEQGDLQAQLNAMMAKLQALEAKKEQALLSNDTQKLKAYRDQSLVFNAQMNATNATLLASKLRVQLLGIEQQRLDTRNVYQVKRLRQQLAAVPDEITRLSQMIQQHQANVAKQLKTKAAGDQAQQSAYTLLQQQYVSLLLTMEDLQATSKAVDKTLLLTMRDRIAQRQGLFSLRGAQLHDVLADFMLAPMLAAELMQQLARSFSTAFTATVWYQKGAVAIVSLAWLLLFVYFRTFLKHKIKVFGKVEKLSKGALLLMMRLARRILAAVTIIMVLLSTFALLAVPYDHFSLMIHLFLLWLLFRTALVFAKICLLENETCDGDDVRLYRKLRMTFVFGLLVAGVTVIAGNLPVDDFVVSFFLRLLMVFVLLVALFLFRARHLIPQLYQSYFPKVRAPMRRIVYFFSFFIPLLLMMNALVGLLGYADFVSVASKYEFYCVLVLLLYLLLRMLLKDGVIKLSELLIRHIANGWLLMEAMLKPLDLILRLALLVVALLSLYFLFGLQSGSMLIVKLKTLVSQPMFTVLSVNFSLLAVLKLLVLLYVVFWSIRWSREFAYRWLFARCKDASLRNSLAIFAQYSVGFVGVFLLLRLMAIDLTAIKFILGGLAVGIGFGLRDLANNFISGLLLLIERPVRQGDLVSIAGDEGEVTTIGFRSITLTTWDHMVVYVPNSEVFTKSFTNWTRQDSILRSVFTIKVHRGDDPHQVRAIIESVLAAHEGVVDEPRYEVFMKDIGDPLLELSIRYYINLQKVESRVAVRSSVLFAIWDALKAQGIHWPLPQHNVHIQELPSGVGEGQV